MFDGLATEPLFSPNCDYCGHPFPAVRPTARFCCDDHRNWHWKRERKCRALVDALMERFNLADGERFRLEAFVKRCCAKFFEFAAWLGLVYRTKKYVWVKSNLREGAV